MMTDLGVIDVIVVLLALGHLRFGDALSAYICRVVDPAPKIIDEYRP